MVGCRAQSELLAYIPCLVQSGAQSLWPTPGPRLVQAGSASPTTPSASAQSHLSGRTQTPWICAGT